MVIKFDTDELKEGAKVLTGIQNRYKAGHKKIVDCVNRTTGIWKGRDGEAFAKQILEFEPRLNDLEKLITMYADFLEYVSKKYAEVDENVFNKLKGC